MISILFLISKVLVLILISVLLISEFNLEISSRSTLLLRKISYEKAFKLVHQSAKTRLHGTDIYPGDTHGLHSCIFISFFNFCLGPGVYTAALEKCMHPNSWVKNQAAKIQLSVVLWSWSWSLTYLILISEILISILSCGSWSWSWSWSWSRTLWSWTQHWYFPLYMM